MGFQEFVFLDLLTDFDETLEENFIVAIIESLTVLFQERNISIDSKNIRAVDDVLFNSLSVLGEDTKNNGVENEIFKAHKFNTSEGSNRANK